MGAPSTKTIGGGADTQTANQYQGMLQGQLGAGTANQAITNLMGGSTDPTKYRGQGMSSTLPGAPSFTSTKFNPLNQNVDLTQFNTNANAGVPNFSNLLGTGQQNLQPLQNFRANAQGGFAPDQGGGGGGNLADLSGANRINYNVNTINQPNADVLSSRAQTLKSILDQQNNLNMANTRQYFSAGGMGSQGSGSMLAQAQQNAYGQNQLLQGLQGVTQQDIGNTLQFGQANSQNQLASLGLQQGAALGVAGLQNTQQLGNYQIGNQANIANMQGQNNASLANMQAMLQAAQGQGQLGMSGLNTALSGALGGGQLGLQGNQFNAGNVYNQGMFSNNATQQNNMNSFNQNSALNQFMQQMFGQQSSNALQNQSLGNQFGLGASGQGMQGNMAALSQLFGGFNQANQIGTPQAQTVQTPSAFSQFMSGVGQIAPYALAPFTGGASLAGMFGGVNPFGGSGGGGSANLMAVPNSMAAGPMGGLQYNFGLGTPPAGANMAPNWNLNPIGAPTMLGG